MIRLSRRGCRPENGTFSPLNMGIAVVFGLLLAGSALAGSVYLNGVNIDGVTNQEFKDCTVVIDPNGDVHIAAKGYEVEVAREPQIQTPKGPPKPVSRRYFLVSESNSPGKVQYDIDVFVNADWVKRIANHKPQDFIEVTRHLHKGKNVVTVVATKNMGKVRKSSSPAHIINMVIGEGNMTNDQVVITKPLVDYIRNASEIENFSNEFAIKGR